MENRAISVIIVTYNHETFIVQALESVLVQDHSLIREIIIGDDCSSDRTVEIVKSYQDKYPDLIQLVEHPHNVGVNENYADLFNRCSGTYTAILEGDDYWLPGKLEIMYREMRKNSDAAMWFHRFQVLQDGKLKERDYLYNKDCRIGIEDFVKDNQIQNLSCCLYRTEILKKVNPVFRKGPGVDYLLHILILDGNQAGFVNRNLSVYRHHGNSIWSKLSVEHQLVRGILRRYEMNELTDKRYDELFQRNIDNMLNYLVRLRSYRTKTGEPAAAVHTKQHKCFSIFGIKIKIKKRTKNA